MMKNKTAVLPIAGLLAFTCAFISAASAQNVRHEIHFPNLPGYQTLKCDLHMHTVFSDGLVWPTVRVAEAWRQGLDAIAITDHVEYHPHEDDVAIKHEQPYALAKDAANMCNLILIKAAEITRDTPPGHFNALFLDNVTALDTPEFLDAVKQANAQGAFVFWNHQGWQGEEKGKWLDIHTTMFENKLFQGMEICNGGSYYPTAHKWCLEKNLTMLGNSDIHDADLRTMSTSSDHRTMTLVFAKERTAEAIKDALLSGRTAVWFKDQLIGRREYLEPLFYEAVQLAAPPSRSGKTSWLQIKNLSDADIQLARSGSIGPASITLTAGATTMVRISTAAPDTPLDLRYTATNFLIEPETGLPVVLKTDAAGD